MKRLLRGYLGVRFSVILTFVKYWLQETLSYLHIPSSCQINVAKVINIPTCSLRTIEGGIEK